MTPSRDLPKPSDSRSRRARLSRPAKLFVERMEDRCLLATIVVNTALDSAISNDGDISLREAIHLTNGTLSVAQLDPISSSRITGVPGGSVRDEIVFGISPIELTPIALNSPLPAITHSVWIEGYSQIGAVLNTTENLYVNLARPAIVLDGTTAGPGANGLTILTSNCLISGLAIVNFEGNGIEIAGLHSQGNSLLGNFIGTLGSSVSDDRVFSTGLGNTGAGVKISSSNNRVGGNTRNLGNVIFGNGVGVSLIAPGGTGNLIQGNFILDNMQQGVLVLSSNNTIGESLDPAGLQLPGTEGGNVISGNGAEGVKISGGPTIQGNRIMGNLIGTDIGNSRVSPAIPSGLTARSNHAEGILIDSSPRNTIGGLEPGSKNVIAANEKDGVRIAGSDATDNRILNNWIGFNIDAVNDLISLELGNNFSGIHLESSSTFVGSGTSEGRNVVSLNKRHGIEISGPGATLNQLAGNFIGLNPEGLSDFGNTFNGIHIEDSANNVVGGPNVGDRNVISGNNNGVVITNTGVFGPAQATGNSVLGNFIGTTSDGFFDLGNAVDGVILDNAPRNLVGGSAEGAGNVLSGNNRGLRIQGAGALGNRVEGNWIGTDLSGTRYINNEIDGVLIIGGASTNWIGGLNPSAGNTIAFNVGNGIRVESGTDNALLSNRIYQNIQIGINLVGGVEDGFGVTQNSPGGPHSGPNRLQNYPEIVAATPNGSATFVQGTLNAAPSATITLQFFSIPMKHASGHGQGSTWIGTTTVTTDASGNATFALNLPVLVPSGQFVTATATDETGNTSEFSNAVPSVPVTIQFGAPSFSVTEGAANATITLTREGGIGGAVAVTFATDGGTATPGSDFTGVTGQVFFAPNETIKTVTIPIADDALLEGNETVLLTLSNPTNGAVLGSPAQAVLTIGDNELSSVQFRSPTFSVGEGAGNAIITVTRNSGVGTLSVVYDTADGSAVAGTNYQRRTGVLTFAEGQTAATFMIPILDDQQRTGDKFLTLSLRTPDHGLLGTPSVATLAILDRGVSSGPGGTPGGPSPLPLPNPNQNQPGPMVTDFRLVVGAGGINGLVLTFDRPIDPTRARNLATYGFVVSAAGPDGFFSTPDDETIALVSAQYNPESRQVLLRPATSLRLNSFYQLVVNGNPSVQAGITDTENNLLDGDGDGVNGGAYQTLFGAGSVFLYSDRNGDRVTLRLARGGLMEIQRGIDGETRELRLSQTIARRSTLKGKVKRIAPGDGRTTIGSISGASGVKLRLGRSFQLGRLSMTSLSRFDV